MSINKRVMLYFVGVEVVVLLVIFLGINLYVGTYYYGSKLKEMQDVVVQIENIYGERPTKLQLALGIEYLQMLFGGEIAIYDQNVTMDDLTADGFFYQKGEIVEIFRYQGSTAYICDNRYGAQRGLWMMYGHQLTNGNVAVLGISVDSLDNTVQAIKNFFAYIVFIAMAMTSIFAIILARSMSEPITALNRVAKEMSKLNFDVKYKGKRKDEIGELGQTLNELTDQLEETINNLKHELNKEKHLDVLRKRFVGQVSHELQTPVSVIKGYIEALSDGMIDSEEEQQEYYRVIDDEAQKMSKMIRELLDLSQLESGSFHMRKESFDLNALIDDIHHTYKLLADKKGIFWSYHSVNEPVPYFGDAGRLEQGIRNIVDNAFKHTHPGDQIELILKHAYGNKYKIIVKNQGDAIPEEQLGYIWESFYKAKTSDKKQGTGLGLAIAASIFKHHHIQYKACNLKDGVGFELTLDIEQII